MKSHLVQLTFPHTLPEVVVVPSLQPFQFFFLSEHILQIAADDAAQLSSPLTSSQKCHQDTCPLATCRCRPGEHRASAQCRQYRGKIKLKTPQLFKATHACMLSLSSTQMPPMITWDGTSQLSFPSTSNARNANIIGDPSIDRSVGWMDRRQI